MISWAWHDITGTPLTKDLEKEFKESDTLRFLETEMFQFLESMDRTPHLESILVWLRAGFPKDLTLKDLSGRSKDTAQVRRELKVWVYVNSKKPSTWAAIKEAVRAAEGPEGPEAPLPPPKAEREALQAKLEAAEVKVAVLESQSKSVPDGHIRLGTGVISIKKELCTVGNGDCSICLDKGKNVIFDPCGHVATCWDCAQPLRACPMCQTAIVRIGKAVL
jgi:hypothetical protein